MSFSNVAMVVAGGIVGAQALLYATQSQDAYIRPPGQQGEQDFLSRCIRCGKCIEACPYESIHVCKDVANVASGTPIIEPRTKACRMCHDVPCVPACPTGALRDVESPRDINMGFAVIDLETCVSYKGLRCEVCYRACPLIDEAISIDYRINPTDNIHAVFAPIIDEEVCTGCGLCVERCITDESSIRIIKDGWEKTESELSDWTPSPRENLSQT